MCTVTFNPTADGFVLTHNRDEAPGRSPADISKNKNPFRQVLFPRDTKAGGTWIATDNRGQTACLLNGAFEKHTHTPPYRHSRGLLLLLGFESGDPIAFFSKYDYEGIEPFTLLFFTAQLVREIRWDAHQLFITELPVDQPHFWNSSTLYPSDMRQRREEVFRNWLQALKRKPSAADLWRLHQTGSVQDPENDYVMNRKDIVRTVSITQIVKRLQTVQMRYYDLIHAQEHVRQMTLAAQKIPKFAL